jgi:predicted DNA-binding protein
MSETATVETEDMAKKAQKTTPVRLTDEAIKYARIASGFTSESMSEYVSRVVAERGKEDMDRFYAKEKGEKPFKGKKGEPKP